ncbi:hypothetical protein PCASD_07709 [Puccinia coronata f. sp. avenae]|uniref:Uncharacterized protein n=1 Tax=Puccinia coronata f. sp. avenae TaxID=200324 RepID=A0A2N5UX13_9BASI|nr:hypothetical protein PCASD_07709 [Puccinia coronata f. sp. avenae]
MTATHEAIQQQPQHWQEIPQGGPGGPFPFPPNPQSNRFQPPPPTDPHSHHFQSPPPPSSSTPSTASPFSGGTRSWSSSS